MKQMLLTIYHALAEKFPSGNTIATIWFVAGALYFLNHGDKVDFGFATIWVGITVLWGKLDRVLTKLKQFEDSKKVVEPGKVP